MSRVSTRSEMLGSIHQVWCPGSEMDSGGDESGGWWMGTPLRLVGVNALEADVISVCLFRRAGSARWWRWWSSMWKTWGECTPKSMLSWWSWRRPSYRMRGLLALLKEVCRQQFFSEKNAFGGTWVSPVMFGDQGCTRVECVYMLACMISHDMGSLHIFLRRHLEVSLNSSKIH